MPVRCPLGKTVQPQGTLQRDSEGMPGRQGGAEVDERITVAVWAGMGTWGELIDASLAGHGDADQNMFPDLTGRRTGALVPAWVYKEYQGAAHSFDLGT